MTESQAARAKAAMQSGDVDGAVNYAREALAAGENGAHRLLALILPLAGHLAEAETHARIATLGGNVEAMDFARLASILSATGDVDGAKENFKRAVEREPTSAVFWNELGVALAPVHQEEAEDALRHAIECGPDIAEIHNNLGNILKAKGDFPGAIASYRAALDLNPDYGDATGNLGVALHLSGRSAEAIDCFQAALKAQPDDARCWTLYGAALALQGQLGAAETAHRRALTLAPVMADAHNNLAIVLKDQGRLDEARESYGRVLSLSPEDAGAHSNLLMCLCYDAGIDAVEMVAAHREWSNRHAPETPVVTFPNSPDPDKILRVGYVSPDFREHSVASFLDTVFAHHDARRVRGFFYSDAAAPDAMTEKLRLHASVWRDVASLNDAKLRDLIIQDEVDVLVDLAGHTANNRLPVFARRAAPIQISWLGYGATTGIPAMDYVLSDEWVDPVGESEDWFTEQILRLPSGFMCYAPPDAPLPQADGGRTPTFGSFNNLSKVNDAVLTLWADILRAAPNARLLLKARQLGDAETIARVRARFQTLGVDSDRLVLHGRLASSKEHLALYGRVDVALDPFPYNGATTTCEALWMGVPVVSLVGDRHVGRFGAGFLNRAGFPEWAVTTRAAYAEMAVRLLAQRPTRSAVRARVAQSPLVDGASFAIALETAYRNVWRRWCSGDARAIENK
ncbi:MAG: tetratricopeptide repeat protein [Rhodospirillaceae bacterium]|nr:tetratricopeptide repeat protein [Rhodospirillaceae bacterium]